MSQLKLSTVAAAVAESCTGVVAEAVNQENKARDRWAKAGKALFQAGARVEALTKGTKDKPNPQQDDSLIAIVERMIVDALTASKKPEKYIIGSETRAFTFGELLALTREDLREIDTKAVSDAKRRCIQEVGSLFGLVRRYVDRVQNPDKAREKGNKKAEPAKGEADPVTIIRGWIANKTKMVDIANVDRFENALTEALVCLTAKR